MLWVLIRIRGDFTRVPTLCFYRALSIIIPELPPNANRIRSTVRVDLISAKKLSIFIVGQRQAVS